MEITYDLEKKDFRALLKHFHRKKRSQQKIRNYIFYVLKGALIIVILYATVLNIAENRYLGISIIWSLIILALSYILIYVPNMQASKMLKSFGGTFTIKPTENGFEGSTALGDTIFNWTAVTSVEIAKDHIFVHFGHQKAMTVPKRAFADEAQMSEFLGLVEKYRGSAESKV